MLTYDVIVSEAVQNQIADRIFNNFRRSGLIIVLNGNAALSVIPHEFDIATALSV